ncbi:MAG: hypothetical protein R3178_04395, partial [Rhodothermales bacterium]|nr:hypothetical protein [Rhodothermales bacterium]
SVGSGAKPEQIELTRTEVHSLEQEINDIRERLRLSTITSPLSGRVNRSFGADTLIAIYDTTAFLVMMVVPLNQRRLVQRGDTTVVRVVGYERDLTAVVSQLGDEVHIVNGREVVLMNGRVDAPPREVLPGASAMCRINVGRVSVWEFIRQTFSVTA